jgi:hypothetical protein
VLHRGEADDDVERFIIVAIGDVGVQNPMGLLVLVDDR